jgi:hypothetical protein
MQHIHALYIRLSGMGVMTSTQSQNDDAVSDTRKEKDTGDMSNVLTHIKSLESRSKDLELQLLDAQKRNEKLSQKTREGMQSALDTLMKKWMDAVETKDGDVKDKFKNGLETLVNKSAEDNGVWQMMVAASSLHERQEHDLDKLRCENTDLRSKVDGIYADSGSRTVGEKSKAPGELCRHDVGAESSSNIWETFAQEIGSLY